MGDLVFEVTEEEDGGYVAECLTEAIFTQADTWDGLREQVKDAVIAHFFDRTAPRRVRLHLVRNEVMALG